MKDIWILIFRKYPIVYIYTIIYIENIWQIHVFCIARNTGPNVDNFCLFWYDYNAKWYALCLLGITSGKSIVTRYLEYSLQSL